jgi:hypothetical protein
MPTTSPPPPRPDIARPRTRMGKDCADAERTEPISKRRIEQMRVCFAGRKVYSWPKVRVPVACVTAGCGG